MTTSPTSYEKPECIDHITEAFQRRWFANSQIVAYKPLDGNRQTIMQFGQTTSATISQWDRQRPYLAIHDLSSPGVALAYSTKFKNILRPGVTEEGTESIKSIIEDAQHFRAKIAIVVSLQFSGHITSMFAQLEARHQQSDHITFEVFTEAEAALNWLRSFLA